MGGASGFGAGGVQCVEWFDSAGFQSLGAGVNRGGKVDAVMRAAETFRYPMPAHSERVAAVFEQVNGRAYALGLS